MSDQPPIEPLYAVHPGKKVKDSDWPVIRSLAEQGVTYGELGERFGVKAQTIRKRSSQEKWLTKQRLAMTKNETIQADEPALAVLDLWSARQQGMRESIYQGSKKALERFFAMSPVPQSFSEAATAAKLLKDAIDPTGSNPSPHAGTTINILAAQGFSPKPVTDI